MGIDVNEVSIEGGSKFSRFHLRRPEIETSLAREAQGQAMQEGPGRQI